MCVKYASKNSTFMYVFKRMQIMSIEANEHTAHMIGGIRLQAEIPVAA